MLLSVCPCVYKSEQDESIFIYIIDLFQPPSLQILGVQVLTFSVCPPCRVTASTPATHYCHTHVDSLPMHHVLSKQDEIFEVKSILKV